MWEKRKRVSRSGALQRLKGIDSREYIFEADEVVCPIIFASKLAKLLIYDTYIYVDTRNSLKYFERLKKKYNVIPYTDVETNSIDKRSRRGTAKCSKIRRN